MSLLDDGGMRSRSVGWFCFTSLDNRLVFVNPRQLEQVALVGDDAEAMPLYEHEEVYKLARDIVFEGGLSDEELNDESSPYSKDLLQRAQNLLSGFGDEDEALLWLGGVVVDTTSGERQFFSLENKTLSDLHGLELEGEHAHEDTFVDLYSEGYHRSTFFRLGSLRSIEVPSDLYSDWLKAELADL